MKAAHDSVMTCVRDDVIRISINPMLVAGPPGSSVPTGGPAVALAHLYRMGSGATTPATDASLAFSASMLGHRAWTPQQCWDHYEMWCMVISEGSLPTLHMSQTTPEIIQFKPKSMDVKKERMSHMMTGRYQFPLREQTTTTQIWILIHLVRLVLVTWNTQNPQRKSERQAGAHWR